MTLNIPESSATGDVIAPPLRGKSYGILTTTGDPFVREARARLIWAANTAQAVQNLGVKALLAGNATGLPIKFENTEGQASVRRMIADMYNVRADFDLCGLYDIPAKFGALKPGQWARDYDVPRHLLPYCGILHTRDPHVLTKALAAGLTGIYEDHDEDHNKSFHKLPDLAAKYANLRVIVAITDAVKARLVADGVPEDRIVVLNSGVNANTLQRHTGDAMQIRRALRRKGFNQVVVYSGGLQIERGIEHMMHAAAALPRAIFVVLGGNRQDQVHWHRVAIDAGLSNVFIPGYLQQNRLLAFQQAADVLLATRMHDARAAITSPLKFFEYMAAGSPVVGARIAVIDGHADRDLALTTYDPAHPESLIEALRASFSRYSWKSGGYAQNTNFARAFTWEERQKTLFQRLAH